MKILFIGNLAEAIKKLDEIMNNEICFDCKINCKEEEIEIAKCEACQQWLCDSCIDSHICREPNDPKEIIRH